MERGFLVQILEYCQGREELKDGIDIPDELCDGQYLEGIGDEHHISLCFPIIERLFARTARTWPTSFFKYFAPTPPAFIRNDQGHLLLLAATTLMHPSSSSNMYNIRKSDPTMLAHDPKGNLQLPTPTTSMEEESSSSDDSNEWLYPSSPSPLPSLELPKLEINDSMHDTFPTNLPRLELPLLQLENLQVSKEELPAKGEEIRPEIKPSIIQPDVEMGTADNVTHPTSIFSGNPSSAINHIQTTTLSIPAPTIIPPIVTIDALNEAKGEPHSEDLFLPTTQDTSERPLPTNRSNLAPFNSTSTADQDPSEEQQMVHEEPQHSYYQQASRAAMRRTMSHLLAHMLLLINLRFGNRTSYRTLHHLHEFIPHPIFDKFFREYRTYTDLAKGISAVREDQQTVPNRWQAHLPCLRRIRQLLGQYIDKGEALVKNHGYLDGLREYVVQHDINFWHNEPQSIFYYHEGQYLYALQQFLDHE